MSGSEGDDVGDVEVDVPRDAKRKRKKRRQRAKARRQRRSEPADEARNGDDDLSLRNHLEQAAIAALPHQRRLALGGSLTIVGLALVGSTSSDIGAIVVLAGLLALMYAIHRYGRLGVER